jgi:hypothetical protein
MPAGSIYVKFPKCERERAKLLRAADRDRVFSFFGSQISAVPYLLADKGLPVKSLFAGGRSCVFMSHVAD